MDARTRAYGAALMGAVLVASCESRTPDATPIRVALGMALSDPTGVAAVDFRDRMTERLGSRARVRLFPRGTLGGETAAMEGALAGDIDVVTLSNIVLASLVPELHALDVPFGLTNADHAWRVLDGPIGDELNERLLARGLRVLGWSYAGSRQLMFRDRGVETPDDLRGMKLRVPANPMYAETVQAWGASPTTIAWPEVYLALSQGVVDGIETAPGPSFDQRHYEVASYLVRTDHVIYFHVWLVSEKRYQSWPNDVREAVAELGHAAALMNRRLRLEEEAHVFQEFERRGVTVVVPDVEAFSRSAAAVVATHTKAFREILERMEAYE